MTQDGTQSFLSHLFPSPPPEALPAKADGAVQVEVRPALQRRAYATTVSKQPKWVDHPEPTETIEPSADDQHELIAPRDQAPVDTEMIEPIRADRPEHTDRPRPEQRPAKPPATDNVDDAANDSTGSQSPTPPSQPAPGDVPPQPKPDLPKVSPLPEVPEPIAPPASSEPTQRREEAGQSVTPSPAAPQIARIEIGSDRKEPPAVTDETAQLQPAERTQPARDTSDRPAPTESPVESDHSTIAGQEETTSVPETVTIIEPFAAFTAKDEPPRPPEVDKAESVAGPSPEPERQSGSGLTRIVHVRPPQRKPGASTKSPAPIAPVGVTLNIGRIEILARPEPVRRAQRVFKAPRSHQIESRILTGRRR